MPKLLVPARWGLLCFLATMPWIVVLTSHHGGHDGARLAQMVLWAAMGGACVVGGGERLWGAWGSWGAALALGLSALAVWRSPEAPWAGLEWCLWVGALATASVVAQGVRQDAEWRTRLAWTILGAVLLYHLQEVVLVALGIWSGFAPKADLLGLGYDNYRFLNHMQTVALPMSAVAACWLGGRPAAQRAAVLAMALGLAVMWATRARASSLALVLAWSLVCLLSGDRARGWWRLGLQALLAALLIYGTVWLAWPAVLGLDMDGGLVARLAGQAGYGDDTRWRLLRHAWATWQSAPWLGAGPMHLAFAPGLPAAHPHQLLLQCLAEWGSLPTALAAAALLAWLLGRWRRWRAGPDDQQPLSATPGLFIAVLASLVDAQFSGSHVMPVSLVWIALAWGALTGSTPASPQAEPGQCHGHRWQWLGSAAVAMALLAGAAETLRQWPGLEQQLRASAHEQTGGRTQPRFWSHARIGSQRP
jgi:putative inorganic carbon (hco3(-)) transporter